MALTASSKWKFLYYPTFVMPTLVTFTVPRVGDAAHILWCKFEKVPLTNTPYSVSKPYMMHLHQAFDKQKPWMNLNMHETNWLSSAVLQANKRKHKEADAAVADEKLDVEEYRAAIESFNREDGGDGQKPVNRPPVTCLTDLFAGIL
jgi:hypothetical protein